MPASLYIVTGSSRGMGRAVVEQLLQPRHVVVGIARRREPALDAMCSARGATLEQWTMDLADAPAAAARLREWLAGQDGAAFGSATLINNAALLSTPAPLDRTGEGELSAALRVGLEAPMLLCAMFLSATRGWAAARRVLNVSSGLGRRAMAGSAAYCAVKAGMDHFSRAVALEQAAEPGGARIESVAPGVIDTDMQRQLRGADPGLFPERAMFAGLHAGGQLATPDAAAARLLARLERPDFGAQPVTDVRG